MDYNKMPANEELERIKTDASEKYKQMLDISARITDDYNTARRLDVEQLRNLLVQISIVSFGSVGFSIPIIGSSSLVKDSLFFAIGLLLLIICAVGGLWYSGISLENSIIGSYKSYKGNKEEVDEAISNQVFLMKYPDKYDEFVEKAEKFVEKLKGKTNTKFKIDKVLYILLSVLTLGILFIFLSMLPFDTNGTAPAKSSVHKTSQ